MNEPLRIRSNPTRVLALAVLASSIVFGCSDSGPGLDGGLADAELRTDAAGGDAGVTRDGSPPTDADSSDRAFPADGAVSDSGSNSDASPASDGGQDAGQRTECNLASVRCVDDTLGPTQEYVTIQAAANAVQPGDSVLVASGRYAGFQVDTSGTRSARILFRALGSDVVLDSPAGTGDGVRLQNVSFVTIEGFRIESPPERCIAARGATPESPMLELELRGNTCRSSGVEGFYLSEVGSSLVEANDISGSGASGDTRSHGIYLANAGSDGTVIRRNMISDAGPAESNGIHVNGDLSVGGDGLVSGLTIEQNVIRGNAQNGINLDGVDSSVIRNNLIFGNARNAVRAYAIDGAQGPRDLRIVNNSLVTGSNGWAIKLSEDRGGHVVFNNVLLSGSSDTGAISVESASLIETASNVVVGRFSADGDSSVISLAEWQELGLEVGSIEGSATDLFVDPELDLRLRAGAAAVDRGVSRFAGVEAPSVDFEGSPRPTGAGIDVGGHERP
ncbi:MAG: right-handed parallel beta-helix repeat-containing protein [Deltaproteobacteria bacterium]|nr:right-handed parallel beta-helix repeat-containing protein [Deltaproteobacteria bacterium]